MNTQQIKRSLKVTGLIDESLCEILVTTEVDHLSGIAYGRVAVYGAPDQMQNIVSAAALIGYANAAVVQGSSTRVWLYDASTAL